MIANHFKLIGRSLILSKFTTAASILVLSMGIVSFIAAFAVIDYWRKGETQFENADRIYVMTKDIAPLDGGSRTGAVPQVPMQLAEYVRAEFPELEAVARGLHDVDVAVSATDRSIRLDRLTADSEFLEIFDLPFVAGDPQDALRPGSVVLTQQAAEQLFGDENPIGQSVVFAGTVQTTVTGVISPIKEPSHFAASESAPVRFDVLTSWSVFEEIIAARVPDYLSRPVDWQSGRFLTYALLPGDGSLGGREFQSRLSTFAARHIPLEQRLVADVRIGAIPVNNMMTSTLDSVLFGGNGVYLSVSWMLLGLGGLILFVACVNYANLAAARAVARTREIALRKSLGATSRSVIAQLLLEVAVVMALALVVACVFLMLATPLIRTVAGMDIRSSVFDGPGIWFFLGGLLALATLVAGAYPAAVLSGVRPAEGLRFGKRRGGSGLLSTTMVGVQYAVTSFLVVAVLVIYAQNSELRRSGIWESETSLLMIDNPTRLTGVDADTLRAELSVIPQIEAISSINYRPWSFSTPQLLLSRSPEVGAAHRPGSLNFVGENFFSVFDFDLLAGRVFDRDRSNDVTGTSSGVPDQGRITNVVIDDSLVRELGFASAQDSINELIYDVSNANSTAPLRIIGVVATKPLHLIGFGTTGNIYTFGLEMENEIVRLSRTDVGATIASIETIWDRISPDMSLSSVFVDELFESKYQTFGRVNWVFAALALCALIISTMGLAAMTVQECRRRLRELAVRKILGATTFQMMMMQLVRFGRIVLLASVFAWPVAYIACSAYLNMFVSRITLSPAPFLFGLLTALAVSCTVVAKIVHDAARVRPADVLRSE